MKAAAALHHLRCMRLVKCPHSFRCPGTFEAPQRRQLLSRKERGQQGVTITQLDQGLNEDFAKDASGLHLQEVNTRGACSPSDSSTRVWMRPLPKVRSPAIAARLLSCIAPASTCASKSVSWGWVTVQKY